MATPLTNAAEFTVSEIANAVKRTVEDEFGHVRVRGEISGFRGQHSSGHAYFTLKDEGAALDAVIWKGTWPRLAFKPEEGLEVIATGRLTTFPRSSKYQIVIEQIEPAGAGALMALLEERRKKLLAEGLFAAERKRALPYLPEVIGVVTSPTGAVIRDILHRLSDRFPRHVLVWPVRVQGETSAAEVAAAVEGFNSFAPDGPIPRPDLLIVARGGGSIEDLWGFNEEIVVRAVAASRIPVIAAIGHETDTTLVDFAADHRAPTPTAAAEAAVPVRAELIATVDDLGGRLRQATRHRLAQAGDRLRAADRGLPRASDLLATPQQRLDLAASRLGAALRHAGQSKRIALSRVAPRLGPQVLTQRLREATARLGEGVRRVAMAEERGLERRKAALDRLSVRLSPVALRAQIREMSGRLAPLSSRLSAAARQDVTRRSDRLAAAARLLGSVSYRSVLARGFAIVSTEDGRLVRTTGDATPGARLMVAVADGSFAVTVDGAAAAPPSSVPQAAPARRKTAKGQSDPGQESLF